MSDSPKTTTAIAPMSGSGATTARQGFGEQSLERKSTAAAAMAARAQAEVQARYVVALQRPRNVDEFRVRLLDHCRRERFAKAARYSKPVGGKKIEGASVRFVETALSEYGNVLPESSVIFEDEDQIVIRVTVTDLERNITHAAEATIYKRVERKNAKGQRVISSRLNSYGEPTYLVEATDDDVANMKASRESKLVRNLGLRILPADVVAEAMDLCISVIEEGAARDPAAERKRIVDAFHSIGVSPAQLVKYLGHPLEQVNPAQLVDLRQIFQAIRDEETSWAAIMASRSVSSEEETQPSTPARNIASARERLRKRRDEIEGETDPPATPPETPDEVA